MENESHYIAAELNPIIINDIKSFEHKLSEETHKKVVVIAYEKRDLE